MVSLVFNAVERGGYEVKLFDLLGRIAKDERDEAIAGSNTHALFVGGLSPGIYTIILQKGDNLYQTKIAVD